MHTLNSSLLLKWVKGIAHASSLAFALLGALPSAQAQSTESIPQLEGITMQGDSFRLKDLRGKVVMLMFWSTDCQVCRDKMPELRQNVQGWKGQPFELVMVSTDRSLQDMLDYDRIVTRIVAPNQRFIQLWSRHNNYRDTLGAPGRLPATWILDKQGRVVYKHNGRIPPEVWDQVADLL